MMQMRQSRICMLFDEVDEVELKDEEEVCVREKDGREGSYQGVGGREGSAEAAKKAKTGNNLTSVSLLMIPAMMQIIAFFCNCIIGKTYTYIFCTAQACFRFWVSRWILTLVTALIDLRQLGKLLRL